MAQSKPTKWILIFWAVFVGGYALVSALLPEGPALTAFGDIMQCLVPLFASMCLLLNSASAQWSKNAFWMLMALGCTLWMAGQLLWTYFELILHQPVPDLFIGDVIMFVHLVPMMAALALQPHLQRDDRDVQLGHLDFSLLLLWWVYLYVFTVIPWQYIVPNPVRYSLRYEELYALENAVLVAGLAVLVWRRQGAWGDVYKHLLGAAVLFVIGAETVNLALDRGAYFTGSFYDLPLVASFVWFGTAGILGLQQKEVQVPAASSRERREGVWSGRLAICAILSLPLLAVWSATLSNAPEPIRQFRLFVTLEAILMGSSLVFLRQRRVDQERARLLHNLQDSLDSVKRLEVQFVQAEKLASLGQLAAGAAHEINNPLAAILGFSEVLAGDETAAESVRRLAGRIGEQARRTKNLVNNLLSFARQAPGEKTLVDINAVLVSAVQLRSLDLSDGKVEIQLETASVLPTVRGDPDKLLQVFYNIISNAVDALTEVGGGLLKARSAAGKGKVIIEFTDNGPGIRQPNRVFDPFYTTKPVGRGTGLGLSICYGIVQDHGGQISCENRREGGARFRIELPPAQPTLPAALVGASQMAKDT